MSDETEKTCPGCGMPVKEGAAFCTNCGASVGAPGGAETSAAPPAAGFPTGPPPRKRNKAALLAGVIGGALVIAAIVVLVLWLAVWRDGGGGSGTGDPIALAEKYISALERGDIDAYLDCFEEGFLDGGALEGMGMDIKELLEMTFEMMEVEFKGYALELKSEDGSRATVVTTEGTVTMSVMGFKQEFDLAEDPMVFEMVKKGGRWYLTQDPMPGSMGGGMDFDLDDFEDFDFEDLEDFNLEDLNMEDLQDLESFLPEGMSLEDLENMSPEELMELLEQLEQLMEGLPSSSS